MTMADSTLWWLATGIAVAVEMVTGTYYLLMVALGLAVAAVVAHLGFGLAVQCAAAAIVGSGATYALYLRQKGRARAPTATATANTDVIMDIGAVVQVEAWNPDGTASVQYRGSQWTAIHRSGNVPSTGAHRIAEMVGNRLLLDKV